MNLQNYRNLAVYLAILVLGALAPLTAFAADLTPTDPAKVIVTRNADDVRGLTRVGDVNATARRIFGDPTALRSKATDDLKNQAAKLGASIVLIQADNFSATPINNVNLIGVAYSASSVIARAGPVPLAQNSGAAITETDFAKVVVTRNPDDVKGLVRASDVEATARRVFGDPTALRAKATDDLKKQAAKLGASIVLIQADNFSATPINNVNLIGVAYFAPSSGK